MNRTTPEKITKLGENEIFVFGSNGDGIHGKGAAKDALKFGAVKGVGYGHKGQTFAIPTKYKPYEKMPIYEIRAYVSLFLDFAEANDWLTFLVTPIACGLAGYTPEQIAPLFKDAPENVHLPASFWKVINNDK